MIWICNTSCTLSSIWVNWGSLQWITELLSGIEKPTQRDQANRCRLFKSVRCSMLHTDAMITATSDALSFFFLIETVLETTRNSWMTPRLRWHCVKNYWERGRDKQWARNLAHLLVNAKMARFTMSLSLSYHTACTFVSVVFTHNQDPSF